MNTTYKLILASATAALVALTGCGGGGGSVAGVGGIGGTGQVAGVGVGTTTGFGSVIINDVREFTIDSQTTILRDGAEITEEELELEGRGFATRVEVGTDVSDDPAQHRTESENQYKESKGIPDPFRHGLYGLLDGEAQLRGVDDQRAGLARPLAGER